MGELAPRETLQTKRVDPLALGTGKVVGNTRPLGTVTRPVRQQHRASVQSRLAYCPAWGEFWDLWRRSWTDWTQHACQWQKTATSLELWLCARLLIPLSLIDAIPTIERHKLRAKVGLFHFRRIQAVQTLRRKFADPTPQQPPSPLLLTRFVAQTLPPRETAQNLRNQVGAPMRCDARSRKRRAENSNNGAHRPRTVAPGCAGRK